MAATKMQMLNLLLKKNKLDPNKCALVRVKGQTPTRPFKEVGSIDLHSVFGDEADDLKLIQYKD